MTQRPTVQPPAPWAFPPFAEHRLANGTRLLTYDLPGQHVLAVRHVLPAPLRDEPRELEGVAQIAAHSLDEGAGGRSSEELAAALERAGADLGAWVSESSLGLDVDVIGRNLVPALELAADCLVRPELAPDEVARQVRSRLADIELDEAYPAHRVAVTAAAALYPETDRASRPRGGTAETVARVTAQDVRAFHAAHLDPRGATLVVAGDLRGVDVRAAAEATFGSWAGTAAAPSEPTAVPAASGRTRIILIDRPGATQSELSVSGPGPSLTVDGGWAPYPVLAFVVGGGPTARIDALLREEKGYTYGLRAGFRSRVGRGVFGVSGSVRGDATVPAVDLLLGVLDGAGRLTQAELDAGAAYVARTAPGRYASAAAVADEAVGLLPHGLTTQHTTDYLRALPELTLEEVEQAWSRWRDGTWTVVISGDAGRHAEGLAALGRGEVEVVG